MTGCWPSDLRRIIDTSTHEDDMDNMDNRLNDDERDTVVAVLRTHAEIQAQEVMKVTEMMANIRTREPGTSQPLIDAMEENNEVLDQDCVALNKLADKVEQGAH